MMFSIPLAAIGAFWLLSATGHSLLNANSLMGFLILFGVVVGNGIILIDFARGLKRRGYSTPRALIAAGQDRIRPIFITAITTAAGMLPLALGKAGTLGSIGAPFALTVIGGIISAAFLTLVFIPTCYLGMESALAYLRKLSWKVHSIQIGGLALAAVLIFAYMDDALWRLADLIICAVAIPATVWLVRSSLRRAAPEGAESDEISIRIRNVQKIYNLPGRFGREWNAALALVTKGEAPSDLGGLLWQVPVLGFLFYFEYLYLDNGVWQAIFALVAQVCILIFADNLALLRSHATIHKRVHALLYWGLPLANSVFFACRWNRLSAACAVGTVWYIALAILVTARRLKNHPDFDVRQPDKPWADAAFWWCTLVRALPVVGGRRAPFHALKGVSLEIGSGMYGLLGPNGAGKSTLLRIVAGIYDQTYGKVYINGKDTSRHREELQGLIGYLPQEFGAYSNLTAQEFLDYQAIVKGLGDRSARMARIRQVLDAVHMAEHAYETIGSFSGGMRQRIGIAQILLHLPRILVVDEPTAGLDPGERIRFRNLLVELSRDRIVIFSTHIIEDVSSSCNRLAVLMAGNLMYEGAPAGMLQHASGRVWQVTIDTKEYDDLSRSAAVVRHIGDRDRIRVRCIADAKPHPMAVAVAPTLEDAYLCFTREIKRTRQ